MSDEVVATLKRVTNSRALAPLVAISSAAILMPEDLGALVTVIEQVLPTGTAVQPSWMEKSVLVVAERIWSRVFPVLVRVTVWGAEVSPTEVAGKLRDPVESVKVVSGGAEEDDVVPGWPVRSMRLGLDCASDSMVRVPASGGFVVDSALPIGV